MVNLPWAGMTVGGMLPRAGAGSEARTGMILGLGRSLFSLKTLEWEVNILEDARYQQKYDTFKSVYHPVSKNDVELAG